MQIPLEGKPEIREGAGTTDLTHAIEHFKVFRDYVQHEDDLISNRLSFHNTIQGLLFAAYGVAIGALNHGAPAAQAKPLIVLLPIVGVSVSVFALTGVLAARRAIGALDSHWISILGTAEYRGFQPDSTGECAPLPLLTGGGDPLVRKYSTAMTDFGIPTVIGLAWVSLILFSIEH